MIPPDQNIYDLHFFYMTFLLYLARKYTNQFFYPPLSKQEKVLLKLSFHHRQGIADTSLLEGDQYVYQENLGGLYSTCNDCDYMVFGDIGVIISAHVMNESLK
ncbi:hypothetical protein RhiirA5_440696, partial [Rhizophagus irregularis]